MAPAAQNGHTTSEEVSMLRAQVKCLASACYLLLGVLSSQVAKVKLDKDDLLNDMAVVSVEVKTVLDSFGG